MNCTYVTLNGSYVGTWEEPLVPDDSTLVGIGEEYPESADQPWLFPGWGVSPSKLRRVEDAWREDELLVIADQLDALEEAEENAAPEDLLPGGRAQWLKYRGAVRNWAEGKGDYPDITKRPKRPT
ncbi:hypothetical protein K5F93_11705 [Pseudomonas protegens]|uniref:hypothetical protein n=1 Tax=Pseudomonas protegens TaxID=380021 RepID=UPI001C8E9571|nr:hypothetical protein [Pseudomonas protegens]QZI72891.1 hypothetical protein K5F93_11705 [Pseudomonas protegens]